ncbi:uncharacterized protein LOC124912893 [Impatiens glandulifera]|uniref:uncharacterized protein LOC124912893 n=1 Tax=Impatiens glandulifera TaxID=253017 RepID=UPI001FB09062|nr:uncharacterized protein LOC124912893 [Impatiens glandulifera]
MREFFETIKSLELIDFPLEGGQFTFRRDNGNGGSVQSRIDRFLVSNSIFRGVSNIFQKVLPWNCFNHRPILIERREVVPTSRPFKFENKLLTRDCFNSKVEGWWTSEIMFGSLSSKLFIKLKNLQKLLKSWFVGALFCFKVEILSREILTIDDAKEVRDLSITKISTRIHLVSELLELCKEEEIGEGQHNRAIWLREGDKNTKYLHGISKAQSRNNVINSIFIVSVMH